MSSNAFSAIKADPAVVRGVVVPALTPSNSNVLRFTSSVAAASQALPRPTGTPAAGVAPTQDWRGRDVEIVNGGTAATDFVFFAFSKGAAVALVNTAASATGAPATTRGEYLAPGARVRRTIPSMDPLQTGPTSEDVFFNWIAAANTPELHLVLVEHDR